MAVVPQLKEHIMFYRSQGLSFFPLPYKAKRDEKFKWGEYQTRRPTDTETQKWFGNGTKHNIAVVCGQVSNGLVILDCDTHDRFFELGEIIREKTNLDLIEFTRCSETGKGCHIWLFVDEPVSSTKFPNLDIKAEGGYIVAPPSLHPEGKQYKWINNIPINRVTRLQKIGIDLTQKRNEAPEHSDNWVTETLKGIGEGGRNDACYRLAAYFKNKHPQDITERLLLDWNKRNSPPSDESEILRTIKSAYGRPPLEPPTGGIRTTYHDSLVTLGSRIERDKSVTENVTIPFSERIENWVVETSGWFSYEECDKELGIRDTRDRDNRRQIIKRLREAGKVEAHPKQNKLFRYVKTAVRLIDFKAALSSHSLTIKYPFQIEQYFKTYPGNIIVIAGAPDAGKTAFLLNFIRLNQFDYSIFYQSSEMGQDELANRLKNFENISLDEWNFTAEERSSDFADIIRPDCVNIIDYMELSGEFYLVAEYLKQIHDKLASGIAIVALQKDPKADQGRGGTFGLEKPRLYLNLDAGKITIRKAKNWTQPDFNPNRLELNFRIIAGCKFLITNEWHRPDDV